MSSKSYPSFTKALHHASYPEISPSNPTLSAEGMVILITGGGAGIGKATAAAFIEAGATAVILIGRTESSLKAAQAELSLTNTHAVDYYQADITDPAAVEDAFSTTVQRYGKIDVLVNIAGHLSVHKPLAESPLDDYWRGFEINIKGPIVATQAFLKIARPGATIINVSSVCVHFHIFQVILATVLQSLHRPRLWNTYSKKIHNYESSIFSLERPRPT
jgi:NAD(P)-dependent dehydrogenase (short-subunit alcohol dehydrogenase family)